MYSPFFSVERDVLKNNNLTNTDKLLYIHIVALSNNKDSGCFANNDCLCNLLNIKTRQLYYSLKKLKNFRYIKLIKLGGIRFIIPTINDFVNNRESENKIDLVDYDWLNESEDNENE